MKKAGVIVFLFYLVIGLYFINMVFNFYEIPEFISQFNELINFIGGILIILGGINYLRLGRGGGNLIYPGFRQ